MSINSETLAHLPNIAGRYQAEEFSAAEYAAYYVIVWQIARHGNRAATRRSRRDSKFNTEEWFRRFNSISEERSSWLADFFERYDLHQVSRRVNIALTGWLRNEWNLTLCEKIPGVREVLRMQAEGTRPVTVIADYPRMLEPVLDKSDAFAFIEHDLEHAWQFFQDPASSRVQQCFAQVLDDVIEQGVFASYMMDPIFAEKLNYLAADMNTHIMHSLQYLRAILLEFHLRAEGKDPRAQLSPASRDSVNRCLANFDKDWGFGRELLLS